MAGGCDPNAVPSPLFVELFSTERRLWLAPRGPVPQARGRLGIGLAGGPPLRAVRYRLLGRQSAFLFGEGDLNDGYPRSVLALGRNDYRAAQLPAVPPGETEAWLGDAALQRAGLTQVTSFRVYDQGLCSALEPWDELVQRMAEEIREEVERDSRLRGVQVKVTLEPVMQSDSGFRLFPPRDWSPLDDPLPPHLAPPHHDGFRLELDLFVKSIDLPDVLVGNCSDEHVVVGAEVEIERTPYALVEVSVARLLRGCRRWDEATERPTMVWDPIASEGEPGDFVDWPGYVRRWCLEPGTVALPHFGTVAIDDIDFVHHPGRATSLHNRRDLTREGPPYFAATDVVLVGLRDVRGRPVGAHDPLLRIRRLWSREINADCLGGPLPDMESMAREQLRERLPLQLAKTLREKATVDPAALEGWLLTEIGRRLAAAGGDMGAILDRELVNAVSSPESYRYYIPCNTDADCDASDDEPAFAEPDGAWRGARHVCKPRDPQALLERLRPMLEAPPDASEDEQARRDRIVQFIGVVLRLLPRPPPDDEGNPGKICHAVLEPDWVNVRPDGMEVVLLGGRAHPQASLLLPEAVEEQGPLGRLGCDADGDGLRGSADDPLWQTPLSAAQGPRKGHLPPGAYGFFAPGEPNRFPVAYVGEDPSIGAIVIP